MFIVQIKELLIGRGRRGAVRPPPHALVVGARPEEVRVRGEQRLAGLDLGPLWPTPVVRQRRDRQEEDEKIVLCGLVAFLGGLGWLVDAQHIQGLPVEQEADKTQEQHAARREDDAAVGAGEAPRRREGRGGARAGVGRRHLSDFVRRKRVQNFPLGAMVMRFFASGNRASYAPSLALQK